MKKIGFLIGSDDSFPNAILEKINSRNVPSVKAEIVKIGSVKIEDMIGYNVIFDRVSYQVPYYNSILKSAVLEGVKVINNPFRVFSDDNFFYNVLANKMNLTVPRTAILPSKEHPSGVSSNAMRNLVYPLNWEDIFKYVGFPAYLKPNINNSSHIFFKVYNQSEFFSAYDLTGNTVMLLQESIEFEEFYRCYVVGGKYVQTVNYNPDKPRHLRFISKSKPINDDLKTKLEAMSLKICNALDINFNVVEFAIRENIPYVVEFRNFAHSTGQDFLHNEYFDWLVENTSNYLIELAKKRKVKPGFKNWLIS